MNPIKILKKAIFALIYATLCVIRGAGWMFYSSMNNLVSEIETEAELKRRRNILKRSGVKHGKK